MRLAAALALTLALSGCFQESIVDPVPPAEPDFDAEGAYAFVAGLVTAADGGPRPRVPGTPLHAEAADWLQAQMAVPGWEVARQTFTGADYEALDTSSVDDYRNSPSHCAAPDDEELEGHTFHNLVAQYGPRGRMLWLGAHWDSKEEASQDPQSPDAPVLGANDGASGVGILLQFMRHVSAGDIEVPFGLGVVFFDGEDGFEDCHPLAGSLYFAQTMKAGLVDRFLLLDMVGDKDARFIRESQSMSSDPAFMDLLWQHGQARAPQAFTDLRRQVVDDHVPFMDAGVPSVDLIDAGRGTFFPPYWHTTQDTMDIISKDMLGIVGDTIWATVTDASLAWP